MKMNFEKMKKAVKNTVIGAAATFGVMNGSANAQENNTVDPQKNTIETVAENTQEVTADANYAEVMHSQENQEPNLDTHEKIASLENDIQESEIKIAQIKTSFDQLHAQILSQLKGKDVLKNFSETKDLLKQIENFIDYYQKRLPHLDLREKTGQILKDIAHIDNNFTGAKYNFAQQMVNQQVGDVVVRTGQMESQNNQIARTYKLIIDSIVTEYAKKKELEKELSQLKELKQIEEDRLLNHPIAGE
jgi:hypothetical protein